jgi:hypothetical protein
LIECLLIMLSQNAEALRVRLSFAMYKVRTHQINLPMSKLALPPRSQSTSHSHLDTRPSISECLRLDKHALPDLMPYRAGAEKHVMSSPPPTPMGGARGEMETPRLPRSRNGYLRVEESPEKRLTSSVVKGRAAEGLLGLSGRR